jgi:hypothetical protein
VTPRLETDDTAGCRQPGIQPEWFHDEARTPQEITRAKNICKGVGGRPACPFLDPCLDYALRITVSGLWGGTTETERRRLRRERGINAKPAYFHPGRNNAWVARQMHSRGVSVRAISERLGITDQAVRQILARVA